MVLMPLKEAIGAAGPVQAVALQTDVLGRVAIVLTDPTLLLLPPSQQPDCQPQNNLRHVFTLAALVELRHLALLR